MQARADANCADSHGWTPAAMASANEVRRLTEPRQRQALWPLFAAAGCERHPTVQSPDTACSTPGAQMTSRPRAEET